jgi:hypothetical protein
VNDILTDLLASWREETTDTSDLTNRLLDTVLGMKADTARELLYPVILPWVRKAESDRARVLKAEQRVFDRGAARHGNPAQEAMRRLLASTVYVEGQGTVPWGEMTPEYHAIRVNFLQRTMDAYVTGVKATIARHEAVIRLLADNGLATMNAYVERFGELPGDLLEEDAGQPAPA